MVLLTGIYYWVDVTVDVSGEETKDESDIRSWLFQLLDDHLDSCTYSDSPPGCPSHDSMTTVTPRYNSTTTISYNVAIASLTHNYTYNHITTKTTMLYNIAMDVKVICLNKTGIRTTWCAVLLRVEQPVRPCCLLQTLCQAGNQSHNISTTAHTVERIAGSTVAVDRSTDVYYMMGITVSISGEKTNESDVRFWDDLVCCPVEGGAAGPPLLPPPDALPGREPVPQHQRRRTHSEEDRRTRCNVIIGFSRELPVCAVSSALRTLEQGRNVFVLLKERCAMPVSGATTTMSPQQNTTAAILPFSSFMNTTSSPGNTTSSPGNTTSNPGNTTSNPGNMTSSPGNTTSSPGNTTSSPGNTTSNPGNTTSSSLNATSSPGNTTSSPENTTSSPENTTSSSFYATSSPGNMTSSPENTTSSSLYATSSPGNMTSSPGNTTSISVNTTSTSGPNVTVTAQPNTSLNKKTTTNGTLTTALNGSVAATGSPPTLPTTVSTTTDLSNEAAADHLLELSGNVSQLNSSQVDQLVSQLESLVAGPNISLALGNTTVQIVSNLLGASPDALASSSIRIQKIVDSVGLKLVVQADTVILLSDALALSVKPVDGANFKETFFSIADPTDVNVRENVRRSRSVKATVPQGSIRLPPTLTGQLSSQQQHQASRVQFNFYQKGSVFQCSFLFQSCSFLFQDRNLGTRKLISGILGASVANLSLTGLQDNITVNLRNTEPIPGNHVAICVFWDFDFNSGSGGWNSDGCLLQNSTDRETICSCNHLTSFGILLDLSREPITDRTQANILTYITYIGCGVSAIFLCLTLLTYLLFDVTAQPTSPLRHDRKLRKDMPSKILIQLSLALLLLNLVFLVDAWLALYPEAEGLCISTAWFLHYFLLASFTWMGLEAVHMYLALVKVFNTYVSHYMLKFSVVGWGVPMAVVIIVIAVDKDNYGLVTYGKFSDGSSDGFCWLRSDVAFYVAVVAYFCVMFAFNFVMFVVVMVQLHRILRQNPHSAQHSSLLQDMRKVAGLTVLLGLTWGFAFFAWGPVNLAFMYLFAIFNSLQGFFIFVFHCAVKENVRRQWRTYFCCGKLRLAENSDWSRTATQNIQKPSRTGLTSLSSSQSNNSSNSFLAREARQQLDGIGEPTPSSLRFHRSPQRLLPNSKLNR
ncbi:Adhesion G-protein coupled receptor G2 [Merluccius polli]|uniref:Adhesion G-protein coupled receptor G2 n=1 Tax=Merluccius polli TaxID=89951 RepID=A0AA47P1C9_MERPO|nr:Adhesion G-protein coupled receptor G2 [Merluccius polli]